MLGRLEKKTGLAISIKQPWAWLIVNGYKAVENRTWSTEVRGWIGIHTGKGFDLDGYKWVKSVFPHIKLPNQNDFQRGGIVGKARLIDCVTESESEWFFGPYGFVLADVTPLEFLPCRGRLGFFRPELNERAANEID